MVPSASICPCEIQASEAQYLVVADEELDYDDKEEDGGSSCYDEDEEDNKDVGKDHKEDDTSGGLPVVHFGNNILDGEDDGDEIDDCDDKGKTYGPPPAIYDRNTTFTGVNVKTHQTFGRIISKKEMKKRVLRTALEEDASPPKSLVPTAISIAFEAWTSKSSKIRDLMDDMAECDIARGCNLPDSGFCIVACSRMGKAAITGWGYVREVIPHPIVSCNDPIDVRKRSEQFLR